jgi:hypothetical protein
VRSEKPPSGPARERRNRASRGRRQGPDSRWRSRTVAVLSCTKAFQSADGGGRSRSTRPATHIDLGPSSGSSGPSGSPGAQRADGRRVDGRPVQLELDHAGARAGGAAAALGASVTRTTPATAGDRASTGPVQRRPAHPVRGSTRRPSSSPRYCGHQPFGRPSRGAARASTPPATPTHDCQPATSMAAANSRRGGLPRTGAKGRDSPTQSRRDHSGRRDAAISRSSGRAGAGSRPPHAS